MPIVSSMPDLWSSSSRTEWQNAFERYDDVVALQRVARLTELDTWCRNDLPIALAARRPAHVTLPELVQLTEWKMARGVWRAPNLILVRGTDADLVETTTADALAKTPHPTAPIAEIATLAGVGPATASAVASAAAPDVYPFFDELVAAQVPGLGKVAWTLGFYRRYAEAIRARIGSLGVEWTPTMVEQALWANSGGKAATR